MQKSDKMRGWLASHFHHFFATSSIISIIHESLNNKSASNVIDFFAKSTINPIIHVQSRKIMYDIYHKMENTYNNSLTAPEMLPVKCIV